MSDGNSHVGWTKLRDNRTVPELDKSVHNRLRVHENVDLVRRQRKKVVRLDQFQTFVHHGRRIDGYLRPHRPVRMAQRLIERSCTHRLERPGAERPAGSREDNAAHVIAASGA